MQYLVQCTRTRVAPKNLSVMVCTGLFIYIALRGNVYFKKNAGWTSFGLIMFPTVSDCFRLFPTVSDRFRPFHFFWTIYWTTSIYGRLIQCKPVQTMTLKFFWCHPCARTLHQILHLDLDIQYSLKITKSQELVKFNIWVDFMEHPEILWNMDDN